MIKFVKKILMNTVIKFYKDRITTFDYEEKGLEFGDFVEKDIDELDRPFSSYYGCPVDFDDDITVKDFVSILNKYSSVIDNNFSAYNHGINLNVYLEELTKDPEQDYVSEVDFIEMTWATDCIKEREVTFIADWVTFHGRISNFKKQHFFDTPTRAMHIVPMRNWKNLPLKLSKYVSYIETNNVSGVSNLKMKGVKQICLFDLISGFLFDLTCHGTPEQQIIIANNIKSQIKNISDGLSTTPISFLPPGEMFSKESNKQRKSKTSKRKKQSVEELNQLMKSYIDNEDYEKAQEIKNKIKSIKKK